VPILRAAAARQRPLPDPALEAVKTWRYLRLAMVVLVVGLAASVLYEHAQVAGGCWQGSLSGYYYTPVRNVFVGTLVAIGVGLIALKGNTDWEDTLLNLAGACAPVVAFVPYNRAGTCGSVLSDTAERGADIANDVVALLTAGGVALLVLAGLGLAGRWNPRGQRLTPAGLIGFGITVALYIGAVLAFALARQAFTAYGHAVAAGAMFAFIYANVWLNAVNLYFADQQRRGHGHVVNRYTVIGLLMTAAAVVTLVLSLAHWRYVVLEIESSLIVLFALFWLLQTAELWSKGLRHCPPPAAGPDRGRGAPRPESRGPSAADGRVTAPRGGGS
jgi:hypothetical protein